MTSPQLELALGDARVSVPWEGKSLRGLTKIGILLSSKRERGGHEVDPNQYDLFEARGRVVNRRQCFSYAGAPLLVPFR